MKKIILSFILFICFVCNVKAYSFDNLDVGSFISQNSYLDYIVDSNNSFVVFYVDNDDELTKMVSFSLSSDSDASEDYCVGFGVAGGGIDCFDTIDYQKTLEFNDKIEGYIVLSKNDAKEVCNKYSEIKNNNVCQNIITGLDGKNYGSLLVREWKASDGEYKLVCNDSVNMNENITCEFYSSFYSNIASVDFSLTGDDYEIVSMEFADGIETDYDLSKDFMLNIFNNLHSLRYVDEPLFTFIAKPKKDYKGDLNIGLNADIVFFRYADEGPTGFVQSETSTTVNVIDAYTESPYYLKCINDTLTKGSIADCVLSVNATYPIKKINVSFDISQYTFEEYLGTDN